MWSRAKPSASYRPTRCAVAPCASAPCATDACLALKHTSPLDNARAGHAWEHLFCAQRFLPTAALTTSRPCRLLKLYLYRHLLLLLWWLLLLLLLISLVLLLLLLSLVLPLVLSLLLLLLLVPL